MKMTDKNLTKDEAEIEENGDDGTGFKKENRRIEVDHVGFSSLPDQVHRKSLKRGFEFTLLVVGDSGLGKSTLVNSLFMTDLYGDKLNENASDKISKTVSISSHTAELEEKGVRLKLTAVDTPGFGDAINSKNCWKTIQDYIDKQFHSYYSHESGYGIDRKKIQDTRVHCCLYFIPPYVRGLRPIDVETMKALQSRVNIIPIIAKADTLTKKELDFLKQKILNDIEKYEIKIYEFPVCDPEDDESFQKLDEEIKNCMPFAVIGSNTIIESGNKRIRGRVYPWGIVDIESDSCDFTKLRTFLCSSHMQDLKDLTHDLHYENYRTELIKAEKNSSETNEIKSSRPLTSDETDHLLKQKDLELKKMQELIAKMKLSMNSQVSNYNHYQQHHHLHQQQQQQPAQVNNNSSTSTIMASFGQPRNLNQGHYSTLRHNNNNNVYHNDNRQFNYTTNINYPNLTNSTPI